MHTSFTHRSSNKVRTDALTAAVVLAKHRPSIVVNQVMEHEVRYWRSDMRPDSSIRDGSLAATRRFNRAHVDRHHAGCFLISRIDATFDDMTTGDNDVVGDT